MLIAIFHEIHDAVRSTGGEHRRCPRRPADLAALALFTVIALAGCTDAEPLGPPAAADPGATLAELRLEAEGAEEQKALATLRRATAAYHVVENAVQDGFVSQEICIARNPIDGQHPLGIPFVHIDRLLDGELDPEEPEILFYEPQKDGGLRLVGVEMAVPAAVWTEEDPPEFFGHPFHLNEAEGLYGVHIWIWLHNPDGMYASGHPRVSCEFAS